MTKFVIAPHMRLQEWVAEEKGYFAAEGLDYEFRDELISKDGKRHDLGDKVGAYQTIEKGRTSDVSCACHWTVNVAASAGHAKLYGTRCRSAGELPYSLARRQIRRHPLPIA